MFVGGEIRMFVVFGIGQRSWAVRNAGLAIRRPRSSSSPTLLCLISIIYFSHLFGPARTSAINSAEGK